MADKKNITEKQFEETVRRVFFGDQSAGRKKRPTKIGKFPERLPAKPLIIADFADFGL